MPTATVAMASGGVVAVGNTAVMVVVAAAEVTAVTVAAGVLIVPIAAVGKMIIAITGEVPVAARLAIS